MQGWGYDAWEKIEILSWLERFKNDHSSEGRGGCKYLVLKATCPFTSPSFTNAFYFPEAPFVFQKNFFNFSKIPYCFPEVPFGSPEMPSFYLLWASFFKNAFFPADCTFSLFSSELLREIIFALFFCFVIELFIDQLLSCILFMFTFNK